MPQQDHCHHGVAWLDGEFVGLALYDDVYQAARNHNRPRREKTSGEDFQT
jgi:hypothetical protein